MLVYGQSKLAVLMFARTPHAVTGHHFNAAHPGLTSQDQPDRPMAATKGADGTLSTRRPGAAPCSSGRIEEDLARAVAAKFLQVSRRWPCGYEVVGGVRGSRPQRRRERLGGPHSHRRATELTGNLEASPGSCEFPEIGGIEGPPAAWSPAAVAGTEAGVVGAGK